LHSVSKQDANKQKIVFSSILKNWLYILKVKFLQRGTKISQPILKFQGNLPTLKINGWSGKKRKRAAAGAAKPHFLPPFSTAQREFISYVGKRS